MQQLTAQDFESMLQDYGWSYEKVDEQQWHTGFQGGQRYFPLSIRLSQTCVSFEVRPLIDLLVDSPRDHGLSRELLELNSRLQLAKIAVSELGEVSLSCQVLTNNFGLETLGRVLGILGYYADEIAPEIYEKLATGGLDDIPTMLS
ncbi:MAG: hypothetical protein FJ146_04845 [Deltaproteobacteria bacterium]|nr:hypothetical protein [Deltaproteobacteria bacterium]